MRTHVSLAPALESPLDGEGVAGKEMGAGKTALIAKPRVSFIPSSGRSG